MISNYYQALIIITILMGFSSGKFLFNSYKLSKIIGSIVSLFWIYWTLGGSVHFGQVKVWTFSELWFYQIIEAIIAFIVCFGIINWLSSKDKNIIDKEKNIAEKDEAIKSLISDKDRIDNNAIIELLKSNKNIDFKILSSLSDHRKIFFSTIADAKDSICILSGTATSYVVDEEFKLSINEALKKGVNIFIGYGYSSSYNTSKKNYELKAELDLKKLLKDSKDHNGKIFISEYKNHSKMLICDHKYVVCGSFNWLSNARGQNIERSYMIYDKKFALKESELIKQHIKKYKLKI